ncbi:MAG: ribbon-helix-helix protein, CopG family [Methylococcales bacterium]|nr:ribbon-helix-helix protein, CopG family [Methylococcales bacterium]
MTTSVNLPDELLEKIKVQAKEESRSTSSMIRLLLTKALSS